MIDEAITRWTVRAAVGLYVLAIGLQVSLPGNANRQRAARWAWTLGLACYLAHVAAAFHDHHGWSHAAAVAHTAAETEQVVGIAWGGGIWFNHLFTLVWLADALWWWRGAVRYARRARWITVLVHAYMAFIVLHATVIFESGPMRWFVLAATAAIAGLYFRPNRFALE